MPYFCCVKCICLISMEQASKLFRTGYFRVEYQLGCCVTCFPDLPCAVTVNKTSVSEGL